MRRPESDHLELPWRVHETARDFELLDVWRFPLRAGPDMPLEAFIDFFEQTQREMLSGRSPAAYLFRLREWLGRVFGWDDPPASSGSAADEEASDPSGVGGAVPGFSAVYRDADESLAEIQNATVHALLHLGRVRLDERGGWSPQMAVYVKRRGWLGRVYMAVIAPFRHWIVYPTMMRVAARRWPQYAADRLAADAPTEQPDSRFERAIAAIDAANDADPNQIEWGGRRHPKERLHAERASHWLSILAPQADELLRLAVRAHHLRRWQLPRADYPEGRAGYHAWRTELQRRHADEATAILSDCGYSQEETDRVSALIRKRGLGRDPEARHFEDALCLVFVETQLEAFASGHPEEKVVSILARTLPKMSEAARERAAELCRTKETASLLERAVAQWQSGRRDA